MKHLIVSLWYIPIKYIHTAIAATSNDLSYPFSDRGRKTYYPRALDQIFYKEEDVSVSKDGV